MKRIGLGLLLLFACATATWAADLPVTDVVLFSSGVGYFQRTGTVQDNATVELSFKVEQINDLLKSMVLLDLDGGTVPEVMYGAKDPIAKTMQSFAINITDNPSMGQLLNRLRGVDIEVVAATAIQGKILGVETKTKVVNNETLETEVLNLVTSAGIRSVPLDDISSIRILDERLNRELQDALQVLSTGLDNQRKPVLINFAGKGARRVVVGYLSETPIWKTSYRLILDDKKPLLQGWGIVENTSDTDWTNVRLSLVSGRPISFIEDLYTSFYVARPVVQPQVIASIGPVSYEGGILPAAPHPEVMPDADVPMPTNGEAGKTGAPGATGANGRNMLEYGDALRSSIVSAAVARDLGQGFEYAIKDPVTLPRQKSAMLPIVSGPIQATELSIYNPQVQEKYALAGARLKNTTGVHLMGGPITVYHQGVYAGDATFSDLQPGEERLISYAVDLGVTPVITDNGSVDQMTALKLVDGQLHVTRKYRKTVTYTFTSKDGKARTMLVEHPIQQGWTLAKPAKADEVTETLYRFTVPVSADKGGTLTVVEEMVDVQAYALTDMDTPTLLMYAQTGNVSKPIRDALQKAADMRRHLADLQQQRAADEQKIVTITQEQDRLRQNMNALDRNSDLYKRYVSKLNDQETLIEQLRTEIDSLRKQEDAQRKEFQDYVAGLDLSQQF